MLSTSLDYNNECRSTWLPLQNLVCGERRMTSWRVWQGHCQIIVRSFHFCPRHTGSQHSPLSLVSKKELMEYRWKWHVAFPGLVPRISQVIIHIFLTLQDWKGRISRWWKFKMEWTRCLWLCMGESFGVSKPTYIELWVETGFCKSKRSKDYYNS